MNGGAASFDLAGRTALVTGCRRGIGKAAAVALAAAGADVVGVSASLERTASEVGREVEARGRGLPRAIAATSPTATAVYAARRARVAPRLERVDILVNNAGTIARVPAAEHPDELWDRVLEVNLTAQFVLRARARPRDARARQRQDRLRRLAALVPGRHQRPGLRGEQVAAIAGLTKALANEWAARGVNVNAVAPGYVAHRQHAGAPGRPGAPRARFSSGFPAGRWAEPRGHRRRHRLPRSPASDYVHGVVLPVDGGWLGR